MYSQSVPDEATISIARALSRQPGFTLMTLNNEALELNSYRIEKFGISEIFEAFLSSCFLGVRKPIRRFYSRGLGIAHAQPSSSVFIDDRHQNILSASTLGINVVQFKSATQLRSDLERVLNLEIPGA
jgi:putative hydrolase of the HAD superfamily